MNACIFVLCMLIILLSWLLELENCYRKMIVYVYNTEKGELLLVFS